MKISRRVNFIENAANTEYRHKLTLHCTSVVWFLKSHGSHEHKNLWLTLSSVLFSQQQPHPEMSSWNFKLFQKIQNPINSSSCHQLKNSILWYFFRTLTSIHTRHVCISQRHRCTLKGKELPFEGLMDDDFVSFTFFLLNIHLIITSKLRKGNNNINPWISYLWFLYMWVFF